MAKAHDIGSITLGLALAFACTACANGFARVPFSSEGDGAPTTDGGHAADAAARDHTVAKQDASSAAEGSVLAPDGHASTWDAGVADDGSTITADSIVAGDLFLPVDSPQSLSIESSEIAKGWYQYYSGSTQYRPAGEIFDLTLDSHDRPHLFHEHSNSPYYLYRYLTANGWQSDGDVTDDRYGYNLEKVQVRLDGQDLPTIAIGGSYYVSYPTYYGGLHSYRFDSYKWLDEHPIPSTSTSYAPGSVSLALDGAGHAHLAYYGRKPPGNSSSMALIYASWDGIQWQGEEIDSGNITRDENAIALALDQSGSPHIVYLREQTTQAASDPERVIVYAHKVAGQWNEQVVEDYLFIRRHLAMALGPDDNVHVVYADEKDGAVFYNSSATGWSREKVDDQGNVGWGLSIDVDALGRPHLSTIDRDTNQLRYARKLKSGWDVYRPTQAYADTAGSMGGTTELKTVLKVDGQHLPHILVGGFNLDYIVGKR